MRCGSGECRACVWYTWFMYCAANVLRMSVVRGIRGVGGVCEMCMRLDRAAWVESE